MSAISDAYKKLGGGGSWLGQPLGGEKVNGDGKGRRRRYEHGFLFWHPRAGVAGVPRGPIWEAWSTSRRENGALGYPIGMPKKTGDRTSCKFEHGTITATSEVPRTVFFYNTQLISPAGYKGRGRAKQLARLIEVVRKSAADVVVLAEMMDNGDRAKIKQAVKARYPHSLAGPDEDDIEEDGGLLLLSKHPITGTQTIYRSCRCEDCLANKGALLARVEPVNGADFYVAGTHLQAGCSGPTPLSFGAGSDANSKKLAQLRHLDSWLLANVPPARPVVIVGDFNLDANRSGRSSLQANLPSAADLWTEQLTWLTPTQVKEAGSGITSDDRSTYESGNLPMTSGTRGVNGKRIDLALLRQGESVVMDVRVMRVERPELSAGVDLSDHYGISVELGVAVVKVTCTRKIARTTAKLLGIHALTVTSGAGVPVLSAHDPDEVRVRGSFTQSDKTVKFKKGAVTMSQGERYLYQDPPTATFTKQGDITATVSAVEVDDLPWPFGEENETIGSNRQVTVPVTSQLINAGRGRRYAPTVMRGDGSEYVAIFHVEAEI